MIERKTEKKSLKIAYFVCSFELLIIQLNMKERLKRIALGQGQGEYYSIPLYKSLLYTRIKGIKSNRAWHASRRVDYAAELSSIGVLDACLRTDL